MLKAAWYVIPFLLFSFVFISAASADEVLDVQNKINQKNREYSQTQSDLAWVKQEIDSLASSVFATQGELDEANEKVAQIRKKLNKAEGDLALKKDELQAAKNIRDQQVRYLYKHPGDSTLELFILSDGFENFSQMLGFQKKVIGTSKDIIALINEELVGVQETRDEIAALKEDLEKTVATMRAGLETAQQSLYASYGNQASLERGLELIKSDITRAMIRKAELDEQRRAGNPSGDPPKPISKGPKGTTYYYFYGVGRDYYMGHSVGMSQWGAKGYAQKGRSYSWILKKYYTGTSIGSYTEPTTITVKGRCYSNDGKTRSMSFSTYLKGISELLSSWENDPSLMELMKAQAVSARTYAIRQVNAKGYVWGTTADQCWTGNTSRTYWNQAVNATRNKVVKYGGSLATTLYSASHGGHSEHNENVFQGWTGNGYKGWPVAYLRGVSDKDSWPQGKGPYDTWTWNTKYSYTIGKIRQILKKQGLTAAENSWIDSKVGTLTGLGIQRGVSGRVAWVVLYGTRGSAKIPGKVFKASFNTCPTAGCHTAVNKDDVMYSVNFSIGNQVK